jgi:GntR family transcriptional regulator/MocR family aminotransferase
LTPRRFQGKWIKRQGQDNEKSEAISRRPELLLDLIALDRQSPEPLHRQLYLRLVELIMDRSLAFDGRLPSSRALAQKISMSRNTVVSAYQQLEVEGYVQAQRGSQTFVAAAPNRSTTHRIEEPKGTKDPLSKRGRQMISQPMNFFGLAHRRSLQPGLADVTHFPFVTLRRIIAHRLQAGGDYVFGYQHISGYPPLKRAIARYLAAARGVRCEPDQVVITNGAQPAFDLLARILTDPGDSVWMEDPGYPAAQSAFVAAGASIIPLPVSEEGWELSAPPEERLRAIYVTPSCQSPLGVTMRLEQRLLLAEIARARDAWIIEDDFDGEYRFSGNSVPALQSVAADSRTIYVGTFSKTMFPSLRIGYVILPLNMVANISQAMFLTGQYASGILQAALADFIEEGHFTSHLGRMRRLYNKRREDFMISCQAELGEWLDPAPTDSGIQSLWYCRAGVDDVEITSRARENGVVVTPLSQHYRQSPPRHGLILGYTALEQPALQAELKTLRRIFIDLTTRH